MTDLQRAERAEAALRAIASHGTASIQVRVLTRHGLGQFTFSPTMPVGEEGGR